MIKSRMMISFLLVLLVAYACSPKQNAKNDPIEEKIQNLIKQMTLEEKIGQMSQVDYNSLSKEDRAKAVREGRIGSFLNGIGAKEVNEIQRVAVEESRLGIPLIIGRDVIHGYKTIFPIPIGLATTWNTEIVRKAMAVSAKEAAADGIHWTFAPMIDVTWDPRWGRIAESCGEDPYLASKMAVALVKGFQGDDLTDPLTIAACAKHYVGYGMAEAGRDYNTTYIPEPLLRDVHLKPFKAAADAGVLTFMSAFNDLNGVPTSGNSFTLKTILRDEWNYDGFVVSDWASITEMIAHGFAENEKEAAFKAVTAGVDMEMASESYVKHLAELIEEGKISEDLLDNHVSNILRVKFKLGLFDRPYTDESLAEKVTLTDENLQLAREAAREGMVLLKNESVLPLSKNAKVALMGPLANSPRDQLGTWVFDGKEENSVTPYTAIKEILGNNLTFEVGLEYSRDNSRARFAAALAAARKSDVVVFVAGEESSLSGEANARGQIDLPGIQTELIAELAKTGKPVVLVVMAGRPLALVDEVAASKAVLYAWHPGTMAGPALADLLFGDFAPSGKLPVTMVKGEGQIPFYYYRKNTGRPATPDQVVGIDDIPRDFKQLSLGFKSWHIDYGNTPLFPFGFGLSYTTFEYGDVKLSADKMSQSGSIDVSCTVTNTGSMAAKEVVQLYVRDLFGSMTRPIKELKGFEKIELAPGESKEVKFTLAPEDLSFFDGTKTIAEPGEFHVWVATNSDGGTPKSFMLE